MKYVGKKDQKNEKYDSKNQRDSQMTPRHLSGVSLQPYHLKGSKGFLAKAFGNEITEEPIKPAEEEYVNIWRSSPGSRARWNNSEVHENMPLPRIDSDDASKPKKDDNYSKGYKKGYDSSRYKKDDKKKGKVLPEYRTDPLTEIVEEVEDKSKLYERDSQNPTQKDEASAGNIDYIVQLTLLYRETPKYDVPERREGKVYQMPSKLERLAA